MGRRIAQPFPDATPAMKDAYANAAYVQLGHNTGIDPATGEVIFSNYGETNELRGSIADLLNTGDFYVPQMGGRGTEAQRLELAFMMGRLSADLAKHDDSVVTPEVDTGGQDG